ncbi:MAG: acetyl-CoA C-acyltransferase, partial [Bacillota bacterium]|nr:acetyl-CoA C-acyltransferase [Bacillota bacterium]
MSKVTQKLELTRKNYYKDAKISAYGERKPDYSTMGRKIDNTFAKQREVVCVEACRTPYGKS